MARVISVTVQIHQQDIIRLATLPLQMVNVYQDFIVHWDHQLHVKFHVPRAITYHFLEVRRSKIVRSVFQVIIVLKVLRIQFSVRKVFIVLREFIIQCLVNQERIVTFWVWLVATNVLFVMGVHIAMVML
jgi:hypothetical protein